MESVPSQKNWECNNDIIGFEGMEVSKAKRTHLNDEADFQGSILMALLEESQAEEAEEERLGRVIRSLEAEIDPNLMDGSGLNVEPGLVSGNEADNYQFFHDMGLMDGHDCSGSSASHVHDFDWIDMEMESSSPSDEMGSWFMNTYEAEMVGLVEFGDIRDYSPCYYGVPMEEHTYDSLWQETYDSVMYG